MSYVAHPFDGIGQAIAILIQPEPQARRSHRGPNAAMAPALFDKIDVAACLAQKGMAARRPHDQGAALVWPEMSMAPVRPAFIPGNRIPCDRPA